MKKRLQEQFRSRIPIVIRRRNNMFYYQLQIDIAGNDGLCEDMYHEFYKFDSKLSIREIGVYTLNLIKRFHLLGDLSVEEFNELTGQTISDYKQNKGKGFLEFMDARNGKEVEEKYTMCTICYDVINDEYTFNLSWISKNGPRNYYASSLSTGKEGIMTFEEPLKFGNDITEERLGRMVLEAFDRSQMMSEKISGKFTGAKTVDIINERDLEIIEPTDEHFIDYGDGGLGDIIQMYSYVSKEGAKVSAAFYLSYATELNELSCDSISSAWINAYGKADEIEVKEQEYGIYQFRAEIKNKDVYRISYFTKFKNDLLLECCMEIPNPAKKKKLVDALPPLFEQFAFRCRKKP